jgi:hypothetical protein
MKNLFMKTVFIAVSFSCNLTAEEVLLLNDTSNWYHWGCTGTSTALKEGLEEHGHTVTALPIHVNKTIDGPGSLQELENPDLFLKFQQSHPNIVEMLSKADLIVINGEGTLHRLGYGPRSLILMAYIAKTVFNKPVQIINHSLYPEDSQPLGTSEATALYQKIYSLVDFIAIRETASFKVAEEMGLSPVQSFDLLPV